ncbi:hypothetical protein LDVICp142 [lymphocystis disease virus-China]|uniref:RING-type domain-containing protein n=2 Tax=Lymphocystis disease virus 2 TaxID=159183 RepID=A0A6F8X0K1_9VIRU|nr:hypothetical protein LDVICp142 [lymphocystis disease virus-China]AAU10987.1 hypothetical protein [lymphocystis disease virus-China]BCB67494.1 hypothetical protein [Lymphocystis disease virus 2]
MSHSSNCAYCLDDNIQFAVYCQLECKIVVCLDCLQKSTDIASESTEYPVCDCGSHYNLNKTTEPILMPCYIKFIERLKKPIDEKNTQIETMAVMKKVDWLQTIPPVYKDFIEEFFTVKLHNLCIAQAKQELNQTAEDYLKCPFSYCPGTIESDRCKICHRTLCLTCRLEKTAFHECKPEDIESVNVLNNMISCPKCKTKIYKIDRCNNMTCAICKTNFLYDTGKKTTFGSDFKIFFKPREYKISKRALDLSEESRILLEKLEKSLIKEPYKISTSKTFIKRYLKFKTSALIYNKLCTDLEQKKDFNETYQKALRDLNSL